LKLIDFYDFVHVSPLQGLFLEFGILSTNICAALPLKNAAAQQNICSQKVMFMALSCRAAKY